MFVLGGLELLRGGGRQLRPQVDVFVRPVVADAVEMTPTATMSAVACDRDCCYDVEANLLTENESPAFVPKVAII